MPEIRVLDDTTINKIAAGEVIERPASVVKELVENSLDAGATEILITVEKAGKELIKVTDNGCGIPAKSAVLAFERHATSKITKIEDLERVRSMGFRGEALSSIASVASVKILTRAATSETGLSIILEDGRPTSTEELGMECGTTIEVRNLFANVPARAKFLKGDRVEFSHILKLVTERALANPKAAFRLTHNGPEVLNYPSADALTDRFLDVFGKEAAKAAVEIESDGGSALDILRISGMLARPEITKPTTADLHIFVNGRPVSEPRLRNAIETGYEGMLMVGRHPVGVVFIEVNPASIDVNVHPTKREIKFKNINTIVKILTTSVSRALAEKAHIREATVRPLFGEPVIDARGSGPDRKPPAVPSVSADQKTLTGDEIPAVDIEGRGAMPKMRPIGQILNTYILAQSGADLLIIDQHAAHERVMLERVKSSRRRAEQKLISPLPLDVSPREFELLTYYRQQLEELGFTIEPFGKTTFLVRAVPVFSGRLEDPENLMEMVQELAEMGKTKSMEKRIDDIRHLVACHSAIRAGETLDIRQMRRLIEEMKILDNPFTCAHGRPTIIKITEHELKKMFKRVI